MARRGIRAHYLIEHAVEHLYDVTIFDKTVLTTVTKYPEAVTEWINNLDDTTLPRHVGLEIDGADDVIGTVQLCVGTRCLVIQFFQMENYPPSLARFLLDPNNTFCGVDAGSNIDVLINQICVDDDDAQVAFRDLGVVAADTYKRPELRDASHAELVKTVFGIPLEMPRVEANWGRSEKLGEAHVEYACVQAFVSGILGALLIRDGGEN